MTIQEVLLVLRKYWRLLVILPVIAVVAAAIINFMILEPTYTAQSQIYVIKDSESSEINAADLNVGMMLSKDYMEILRSRRVTEAAAARMNLENLEDYDISIAAATDTRIIRVVVEGHDQYGVARVANVLTEEFIKSVRSIMNIDNVNIIDEAVTPELPSGPAKLQNILLAAMAALMVAVGIAFLMYFMDTTIKTDEDVEKYLGLPVLCRIPEFTDLGGGK